MKKSVLKKRGRPPLHKNLQTKPLNALQKANMAKKILRERLKQLKTELVIEKKRSKHLFKQLKEQIKHGKKPHAKRRG